MMDVLSVLMSEEEAGVFVALDYIRQHFFFFFSVSSIGCKDNIFFVSIFNSSSNSSLMFVPCLAEVSMYLHFHILCRGIIFDHIFLPIWFSFVFSLLPAKPRLSFLTLPACLNIINVIIVMNKMVSSCLPPHHTCCRPASWGIPLDHLSPDARSTKSIDDKDFSVSIVKHLEAFNSLENFTLMLKIQSRIACFLWLICKYQHKDGLEKTFKALRQPAVCQE